MGAEILIKTSFFIKTVQAGRIQQFKGNLSVVTSDLHAKMAMSDSQ